MAVAVEALRPPRGDLDQNPQPSFEGFDDIYSQNPSGEAPDSFAVRTLRLTHKALAMVPEFTKRHKKFIGTVEVIGTGAITITSIVIVRRLLRAGLDASDAEVLEGFCMDDLQKKHSKPAKPIPNHKNVLRPQH